MHDAAVNWYLDNARAERDARGDGDESEIRFPIRLWERSLIEDQSRRGRRSRRAAEIIEYTNHASSSSNSSHMQGVTFMRECALCSAPNATLLCTGCHAVRYCNADCQRGHWDAHKSHCAPRRPGDLREQLA
jgi:hypothetical protein